MDERLKIFLMTILLLLAVYVKTLYWMFGSWIFNPYYSHGFLVLAISLYFVYKNSKEITRTGSSYGFLLITISLIIHVTATIYDYDYVSATTLPFAILGVVISFYGKDAAKRYLFPTLFILLAVPYPIYGLTNSLEVLSAELSVGVLKFFGYDIFNVGAEIHFGDYSFIVGAPCSGIRSILALLTVAILYVYIIDERIFIKVILTAISVPLAIFANVSRIIVIMVSAKSFGMKFALGIVHYLSDVIFFIVAILLLLAVRRCLGWTLRRLS